MEPGPKKSDLTSVLYLVHLVAQGDPAWMTYLLISPSRSSICGHGFFSSSSCVSSLLQRHDDAVETRHLKPWRVAELKRQPNEAVAAAKGLQVSRQSGFRARLMALRQENHLKAGKLRMLR